MGPVTFSTPYEYLLFGWACGLAFHATLYYVCKVFGAWRLFDFWSGPRR